MDHEALQAWRMLTCLNLSSISRSCSIPAYLCVSSPLKSISWAWLVYWRVLSYHWMMSLWLCIICLFWQRDFRPETRNERHDPVQILMGVSDNLPQLTYSVTLFYDRVSWSYPAAIIPSLLNVFSMQGYLILNSIVGGQTLAAVSPDRLNATLGIVIIGVVSMVVCIEFSSVDMNLSWRLIQVALCGYRVVHLRVYSSLIIRATLILG